MRCWSLSTLRAEETHTTQATRVSKTSPDPDFDTKAAVCVAGIVAEDRRLDGVLCFDEHGPLTPTPKPGPRLVRPGLAATDPRQLPSPTAVAFSFGVYDVAADQLFGGGSPARATTT